MKNNNAILAGIHDRTLDEPLEELSELAKTAGFENVGEILQLRDSPDAKFYLGFGKIKELSEYVKTLDASCVIFDDELTPAQIRNIQKELGEILIHDRTSLILDIFSARAKTHEGRLQVELAKTKYLLPRMAGYWTHMGRMGGGGGSGGGAGARRGEGETQLEVDRRLLRRKLFDLEKDIEKIKFRRQVEKTSRNRSNVPTVSLIGYTNAGKSTLLNLLSGENVLAADQLFATLDPISRRVNFGAGELILTDTVGFINKLPHDLIDAFRATLEEVKTADLLLHVIDSSSKNRDEQSKVVYDVLAQLGARDKPVLTVYNKCDLSCDIFEYSEKDSVVISATEETGIARLKAAIVAQLSESRREVSLTLPLNSESLISKIYKTGQIREIKYLDDGIFINAIVNSEDEARLLNVTKERQYK